MTAATIVPSPLAGEGGSRRLTDEGAVAVGSAVGNFCAVEAPSSDASRHLLPRGEKENCDASTSPSSLAGESARRADEGSLRAKQAFAKHLRRNMTDVEVKLWNALRGRRFENYKFRRQVPVGIYIVDFLCFEKRLIIELDGSQHLGSKSDAARDAWLKSQNFEIIRFWNIDINQVLDGCLLKIWNALQ